VRLAVDCANGSASETAPAVLSALGADLHVLAAAPDGRNINEGCGSTHLDHVVSAVRAGRFDLGLAFDGDADRVLMVDGSGRACDGDHMLGFLASVMAAAGELPADTVVATVMSNLGLERMLADKGVTLHRTPVGDRHVLAAMIANDFVLGGEASGHLLFAEQGAWIGDGLYTALRVLSGLKATGRTLASAVDAVPRVPQVLLNVPVEARPPVESLDGLNARVAAAEAAHGGDVRIVLRYSGTEDLARVMVEGTSAEVVDSLSRELADVWAEEIRSRLAAG
jgi:phosphoglucosamine mutase